MSGENTSDILVAAVKAALEKNGTLNKVRAQLRASILKCMDESLSKSDISGSNPRTSSPPTENVLINELIAEYLSFNGYEHTLSIFNAESMRNGVMKGDALAESFVRAELGLPYLSSSKSNSVATLYEVVSVMKSRLRNMVGGQ